MSDDFFHSIELSDDDIILSDDDIIVEEPDMYSKNEFDMNTAQGFIDFCKSKYKDTIFVNLISYEPLKLRDVDTIVGEIKSRLFALFDYYAIEHSDIIISDFNYNKNGKVYMYETSECKYITCKEIDDLSVHGEPVFIIVVYVNYSEMLPRTSISYIDKLMKIFWKKHNSMSPIRSEIKYIKLIGEFKLPYDGGFITRNCKTIYLKTMDYKKLMTWSWALNSEDDNAKDYFYNVILYFFGDDKVKEMRKLALEHKNPYTGKPLKYQDLT